MSKFTKSTGRFITLAKGAKLTKNYRVDQLEKKKHKDPVMSQFFGMDKINELLAQEGAIGVRIYYGLDIDGDGKVDKRFVLTATDANGDDILPAEERSLEKDAAPDKGGILITDTLCPFDCPKANALNSDTEETKG